MNAVIFDMDGLMFDTGKVFALAWVCGRKNRDRKGRVYAPENSGYGIYGSERALGE